MAKRDNETTRAAGVTTTDAMEQRVLAFAEQLGRIVGTVQAKAEGWLDREALTTQVAGVRDSAAELLAQLAGTAKPRPRTRAAKAAPVKANTRSGGTAGAPGKAKGRSGGAVDAPGKRHRKTAKRDPEANVVDSQAAKMRMARTMVKTKRHRGRG